jgi:5-formyltetrahydrofolate cyclo-ligase
MTALKPATRVTEPTTHPLPRLVPDLASAKAALRARIRTDRTRRVPAERAADAADLAGVVMELPEILTARCVTLYVSTPSEPGTGPLRAALSAAGIRVLLPIVRRGGRLDWAVDKGRLRPVTGLGGPEPIGPRLGAAAVTEADLLLVPALAVDTLGRRLGQGAGYYDRCLPLVSPTVPVVALVHDGEVLDAAVEPVPTEPHDRAVTAVATPRRCLRLGY